jgi:nucleotide-binding universal stress UspA family protein
MKHKLLIALECNEPSEKVAEYVARACAGARTPDAKLVLFTVMPGLPAWVESGEAADAATQRDKVETEKRAEAVQCLAQVRQYLVAQGVDDRIIVEEISDETPWKVEHILASAKRYECDTIVMARHHKSMVREFFAGDTEEKLLRHPTGFTVWLVE